MGFRGRLAASLFAAPFPAVALCLAIGASTLPALATTRGAMASLKAEEVFQSCPMGCRMCLSYCSLDANWCGACSIMYLAALRLRFSEITCGGFGS